MKNNGDYIVVEAKSTDLASLLKAVRKRRRPIRIMSKGKAIADLSPVLLKRFGPLDPKLAARMLTKGHELTTERDWPKGPR